MTFNIIGTSRRRQLLAAQAKISIPGDGEYLAMLRAVTLSVGSMTDVPIDVLDDVALGVTEAALLLLTTSNGANGVTADLTFGADEFSADVDGDAITAAWPPDDVESGFAWRILSTVTDEIEFIDTSARRGVRLRKRLDSHR